MIDECHYDKHYHYSRFTIQKTPISTKERETKMMIKKEIKGSNMHMYVCISVCTKVIDPIEQQKEVIIKE